MTYEKPDPKCKRCKGLGTYKRRYILPGLFDEKPSAQSYSIRCECTDAKPKDPELAG
jgi:hypothetical protein